MSESTPENQTEDSRDAPNKNIPLRKTDELEDGTSVGKRGTKWYVLDPSGQAVSGGYHEIYPQGDDRYVGKVGAKHEMFTVSNPGTGTPILSNVSATNMPYREGLEQVDQLLNEAEIKPGQYDEDKINEAQKLVTDILEDGYTDRENND